MSGSHEKLRAVFLAFVMVTSVMVGTVALTGTAAAQQEPGSVDTLNAPTPEDVPTGSDNENQNLTNSGRLELNLTDAQGDPVAIEYDLSDTPVGDALTQDTVLNVTNRTNASGGTSSVSFARVNPEDEIATFTLDAANASGASSDKNISVTAVLEGLDTSELTTQTDIDYQITASTSQTFTTDPIASDSVGRANFTGGFNLAFVQVVDESDGDTDVVTSIDEAFNQSDLDDDIDLDQDTTINVGAGTYTPNGTQVVNDSITIQPAGDGEVEFLAEQGGSGELLNISTADDITIRNIAFDFDERSGFDRAVNVSTEAGAVTVDGATFRSPADAAQDAITVSNASDSLTVTGSTFDARPDSDDNIITEATGINVSNFNSGAGSGGLSLTVENSNFDGYGNATVSDIGSSSIAADDPDVDSVTISNNEFNNANIHVEQIGGAATDVDSVFSANTFDQFVVERDDSGDIINATYGDLATAQDEGNADVLDASESVEITGEHTGVDDDIDIRGNSTSVSSPDGSADIELTADEFINISANSTNGGTIEDITVSDLTVTQPSSDEFIINDSSSNDTVFINDLLIENNEFVLGSNADGVHINDSNTSIQNAEITNNRFVRDDDETAYRSALNLSSDLVDTGDQTSVTIADNEVLGAESGFNITANESNDENLDVEIDDNTIQLAESALNGIDLTVDDINSLSVVNNDFISIDDSDVEQFGTDGIALNVTVNGDSEAGNVEIEENAFTDIANQSLSTAGTIGDAGTAIKLNNDADGGNQAALTLSGNQIQGSDVHINVTDSDFSSDDILSLISPNTVTPDVRILDNSEDVVDISRTDENDIAQAAAFGKITAGVIAADSPDEAVSAGPATYQETQIRVNKDIFVESAEGPDATTFTTDTDEFFFNVSSNAEISGFTFSPTADDDQADVRLTSGASNIVDNVFTGPNGENRRAIAVTSDASIEIIDNTVSGYAEGIDVNNADGNLKVVRNTISNNEVGVSLGSNAGSSGGDAEINFNTIAGNTVGLNADDPEFDNVNATAVWWGDQSGPSGDDAPVANPGLGDEVIDDFDNQVNVTPFLGSPLDTLPESGYVIVTDQRDRIASQDSDEKETAEILVATLNPGEESDAADSTVLTAEPSGPISLVEVGDGDSSVNASDPFRFNATAEETGDYTLTARNADGDVDQATATQSFVGAATGVDVTVDSNTLVADEDATVNATLQVIDDNGNPVNKQDLTVQFLVDNSTDANITREAEDTETDVNGQAQLTLSAATAGFNIEVTGVESENTGASDTASFETVEPATADFQLELISGPTQIVQNESYSATVEVTNNGTGTGTQDISYVLEDSAGLSSGIEAVEESVELDPGESQQVTFEVAAEDTDALETGTFTHVFESNDDEVSLDAEVVEERTPDATVTFDDQSVQSGATSVNVASATFNGSEAFNIVVHQATDDNNDGTIQASEIGTKIGESAELDSGTSTDITVNISKQVADNDDVSQLTEDQTLVAMLHTTNTSDDDNIVHTAPITRDGTPVFDQAEITVEETVNVGGEDVPAEFTTTENGETTVTADNAVSAIDTFIAGDINADTAVSVIDAFIASQS